MQTRPELRIQINKPAAATLKALTGDKRYICHEGGSRSGKTFGVIQALIYWATNNDHRKISVVSHSLPHLKRGAMRDFFDILDTWGWYDEDMHNKTDAIYTFDNGTYIEFFGLEDHDRAKGPGRDILFCNEANLLSKALFDQLDMRTRYKVITDLNPSDFDIWCYHLADSEQSIKIHSTYKDNSHLPEPQRRVIEGYQQADEMMWKVYGLGERGASQEQIYTHWRIMSDVPQGEVCYGLDFGFRNPTALVRVTIADGCIFVHELMYQSGVNTGQLLDIIPDLIPDRYADIYCDAAEPKTIDELFRAGFNVKPADKDVYAGIMKVKSMPMHVTASSVNLIQELRKYKWKTDMNGKVIDKEPVKMDDHLVDAMRYAVFSKLKQPRLTWGVL
jgi:phage terminase large subunit